MDSNRSSRSSSPADERRILELWTPDPLVPEINEEENKHYLNPHVITSKPGKYVTVDGKKCLNLSAHNYLGLADHPRLEKASIAAVRKYGVGSCGPRAFYGTMDVHLCLEEAIADFLGVQEAVLYAYGFSTIASAIPAYAKATDIIFVDECCNFAILQGILASKSRVIKFRHNDVKHLEQVIEDLAEEQRRLYGKTKKLRTFLIVESIYAKTGDICPLKELLDIKKKHKLRLFLDESRTFGVLGSSGKGVTEYLNVDINDIDLIMASLENAMCAYGGFCAGSTFVIDHQRLAGAGYCFSASLPPLQTQVALESLKIIREEPGLIRKFQENSEYAHDLLSKLKHLKNISHILSPIKVLTMNRSYETLEDSSSTYKEDEKLMSEICDCILNEERITINVSRYIVDEEMCQPPVSIRVVFSGYLEKADIERVVNVIDEVSSRMIQ